jgi:hypothetical protein
MGRILTIRVQAVTFSPEEVRRQWPKLWGVAFERHRPVFPCPHQGVLELVQAVDDARHFGSVEKEEALVLAQGMPAVLAARRSLERALSDWDVRGAVAATDTLEDALDYVEQQMP